MIFKEVIWSREEQGKTTLRLVELVPEDADESFRVGGRQFRCTINNIPIGHDANGNVVVLRKPILVNFEAPSVTEAFELADQQIPATIEAARKQAQREATKPRLLGPNGNPVRS